MALGRAHTSTKAADTTKYCYSNMKQTRGIAYQCGGVCPGPI